MEEGIEPGIEMLVNVGPRQYWVRLPTLPHIDMEIQDYTNRETYKVVRIDAVCTFEEAKTRNAPGDVPLGYLSLTLIPADD
jgi:hypothetical protein